jgi:WD40 repeat protein
MSESVVNHIKAKDKEPRIDSVHIPNMRKETKFDMQMAVVRGEKNMEDLQDFDNKTNAEKIKKREAEEEAKKNREIQGILPQLGQVLYKRRHGFNVAQFERPIAYVKNYEREQLELPQKHFFMAKTEYDQLTHRVDRLNSNSRIMSLLYVAGINTSAHDNLIWNTRFNCLIYTFENKIILEEFDETRTQTVINLPEYISCLNLGSDGCQLVAGCGTVNHDIYAPVYIVDLESNTLKARMNHHTRGVQGVRISPDGKMILSYGNFKDNKIALWRENYTLLFSTTDINPMNEAKWRPEKIPVPGSKEKYDHEFSIGGKNRLTIWRYHEEYNRCSIKSERSFMSGGKGRDVTALEYVQSLMRGWLVCVGLSTGTICFVDPDEGTLIAEYSISLKEISVIKYNQINDKVVAGTLAGEIFHWRSTMSEPDAIELDVDLRKMKLDSGIINLDLDLDFNEGVASTIDGQIAFISLNNYKFANFIQGVDTHNLTTQMLKLGEKCVLTIQHLGDAKLWNSQTGEILKELKWKETITHAVYIEEKNSICFFLKNLDIAVLPLEDFSKIRFYQNNSLELVKDGYMDNYICKGVTMKLDETKRTYLFSSYKGTTFVTDFLGQDVRSESKTRLLTSE